MGKLTTKQPVLNKLVEEKSWQEFRNTGLFYFINTILHAFGWAICFECEPQGENETIDQTKILRVFPARVKFRGFDEQATDEEHVKIAKYLAETAPNFPEEIK